MGPLTRSSLLPTMLLKHTLIFTFKKRKRRQRAKRTERERERGTARQWDKWRLPWRACKIQKLTLLQKICSYTFDFGLFLWFAHSLQLTDRPSQDLLVGWIFIVLGLRDPDGKNCLEMAPWQARDKLVTRSWQARDKFVTSLWHCHGCSSLVCAWLSTNGSFAWWSIPIGQLEEGK